MAIKNYTQTFPQKEITTSNGAITYDFNAAGYPKHSIIKNATVSYEDACGFTWFTPKAHLTISDGVKDLYTSPSENTLRDYTPRSYTKLQKHFSNMCDPRTITVNFTGTYRWWSVRNMKVSIDYEPPTLEIAATANEGGTVEGVGIFDIPATGELVQILKAYPSSIEYEFEYWTDESGVRYDTPEIKHVVSDETIQNHKTKKTYQAHFRRLDTPSNIFVAHKKPRDIYVGTTKVKEVYIGNTKVFGF